jgi:hypothetical protein
MFIKKYIEFIKEANEANVKLDIPKKFTRQDIEEFFLDFTDNEWDMYINKDIIETALLREEYHIRDLMIGLDEEYYLVYDVEFSANSNTSSDNVSLISAIEFIANYTKSETGYEIDIKIDNGIVDVDEIFINENNEFILKRTGSNLGKECIITIVDHLIGSITAKQLFQHYDFKYDYEKDGNVFVDIAYTELIKYVNDENYENILNNGYTEYEDYGDYDMNLHDLLSLLNQENFYLLIDIFLKEQNGWESFYENELKELDIEKGIDSSDKFKSFLYNERFHNTSNEIFDTSDDTIISLKLTIRDLELRRLEFDYFKIVENAFEKKILESIGGEVITKENKESSDKFFRVPYKQEWVEGSDFDVNDMTQRDIDEIFEEYMSNSWSYDLKISAPESSSINNDELNQGINEFLKGIS